MAELYRHRYRSMGWEDTRLLVQTYAHVDPRWTLKTGSVPLWNRFHMDSGTRRPWRAFPNASLHRLH
ncbi:hypothetical protein GCM10009771_01100 [Nesterenkonia flava]